MKSNAQTKSNNAPKAPSKNQGPKHPQNLQLYHPPAHRQANAPLAVGSVWKPFFHIRKHPKYRDAVIISGSEYAESVAVPSGDAVGKCLANLYINPAEFADSRLAQFAKLYEKYRFTKLRFEWDPSVPATQAGSVVLAYDADIQDATPPTSQQGVRQYCSYQDNQVGRVWEKFGIEARPSAPDCGFYTQAPAGGGSGGDDRLVYQGQLYAASVVPTLLAAGTTLASIVLTYECELFTPQLESPLETANLLNNGTTLPLTTDTFRQFVTATPGEVNSAASFADFIPTLINGVAHLKLREGLYMLTQRFQQNQIGNVTVAAPTIQAYELEAVPKPVPTVRTLYNNGSSANGAYALASFLLNIPRGGGVVTQTASAVSGMAAGAISNYFLTKLSNYMDDVNNAVY